MRSPLMVRRLLILLLALSVILSGCSQINPPEATPVPTPTPGEPGDVPFRSAGVVASGEVTPASVAYVSFDRAGRVQSVVISEDEDIEMGQLLAQLEGQETLEAALIAAYHKGAQLITVLMGTAAIMLIVFGDVVMALWLKNPELSKQITPLVIVLSLGTLLNGLLWIPSAMWIANGWSSLSVKVSFFSVLFIF